MEASLLTRLSPELRNLIYEFTFTNRYAVKMQSDRILHPLTQTCRQLRFETLGMFLSMTRFNAHLDDGPATPLAEWLQILGPEQILRVQEINIWDMHMLNGTLHGEAASAALLRSHPDGNATKTFKLQPVGSWVFNRGWYLKDIILALHEMGLALARFCIDESVPATTAEGRSRVTLTSSFAVVRLNAPGSTTMPPSEVPNFAVRYADVDGLARQVGLSEPARANLGVQLAEGNRVIRLREGHRRIVLEFGDEGSLKDVRQEFTSELEDVDWNALTAL